MCNNYDYFYGQYSLRISWIDDPHNKLCLTKLTKSGFIVKVTGGGMFRDVRMLNRGGPWSDVWTWESSLVAVSVTCHWLIHSQSGCQPSGGSQDWCPFPLKAACADPKKEGQITRSKDTGWMGSRIDPEVFFHPKKLYILAFHPWAVKCRYETVHRCNARFGGLGVPKWWNIRINTPQKTNMETKHWWLAMLVDVFPFPRALFRFHVRFRRRYVNGDKQPKSVFGCHDSFGGTLRN